MFPVVVDMEITAVCNLSCRFCFGPPKNDTCQNLSASFWIDVLSCVRDHGAEWVVFTGGEPTIRGDLPAICRHAKEIGLTVVLTSHGRFADKIINCLPWVDWLGLPIDGITKNILCLMRGDEWDITNLEALIYKAKNRSPNIGIKIGTVATKLNMHEIPQIGVLLKGRGLPVDTWKIYQYTYTPMARKYNKIFKVTNHEFDCLRGKVLKALPDTKFNIYFSSNKSRNRAYMFIYPNGTVAIPKIGTNVKDIIIGNIPQKGYKIFDSILGLDQKNHKNNLNTTYQRKVLI